MVFFLPASILILFFTSVAAQDIVATAPEVLPASSVKEDAGVQLVRLRRREALGTVGKFFYTTRVFVGSERQALNVAFDTSSGQIILPSSTCTSLACVEHRRYRPAESSTAVDINADGTLTSDEAVRDAVSIGFSSLDLGDGRVTGQLLADIVCLAADKSNISYEVCAMVGLVAAQELSETPFRALPFDGSIGLGMGGLAIGKAFSFLEMLGKKIEPATPQAEMALLAPTEPVQQFALYHGSKFGEAAFGGHNPNRLASALVWVPVTNPQEGYWQVSISRIRVGDRTLNACSEGTCRGILDSGTSSLGVPSKAMPEFEVALASSPMEIGLGCDGEDLHIELSGGVQLTLRAEDYADQDCKPSISSLELPESFAGVFIFGEPLLRRYYTVFDFQPGQERLGFGLAAAPAAGGHEETAVLAAEVEEDLQDAAEIAMVGVSMSPFDIFLSMLQAFVIRFFVVITLVFAGTHLSSGRLFACIDNMLAQKTLLLEMAQFASAVPANEAPDGDECVICLGSCEDDPAVAAGVPGLQQNSGVADEEGQCPCSASSKTCTKSAAPHWRRLRCGHHFHEVCIFEWFRKSKQCPTCRSPLVEESSTSRKVPSMATFLLQ